MVRLPTMANERISFCLNYYRKLVGFKDEIKIVLLLYLPHFIIHVPSICLAFPGFAQLPQFSS